MNIRFILTCFFFFIPEGVSAQIYAQGQNINKMNVYTLNVSLEKQLNGLFLAALDFRGRRKDVKWYIKDGAVHKSFAGEGDMIEYLGKNGWVFMERQDVKSKSGEPVSVNYVFRKSMEKLSEDDDPEKQ